MPGGTALESGSWTSSTTGNICWFWIPSTADFFFNPSTSFFNCSISFPSSTTCSPSFFCSFAPTLLVTAFSTTLALSFFITASLSANRSSAYSRAFLALLCGLKAKNKFIFSKARSKPYQKLPGLIPALVSAETKAGNTKKTAKDKVIKKIFIPPIA